MKRFMRRNTLGTMMCAPRSATARRHAACRSTLTITAVYAPQHVENYEYELPSDFEDEEIDEELAFTEEDRLKYGGWFGDTPGSPGARKAARVGEFDDLDSGSDGDDASDGDADEVRGATNWQRRCRAQQQCSMRQTAQRLPLSSPSEWPPLRTPAG